ncbi:hypothetical protein EON66_03690 [archaeon]|nr:MAG: hypothetical protein EON66_03690 [archaeon]
MLPESWQPMGGPTPLVAARRTQQHVPPAAAAGAGGPADDAHRMRVDAEIAPAAYGGSIRQTSSEPLPQGRQPARAVAAALPFPPPLAPPPAEDVAPALLVLKSMSQYEANRKRRRCPQVVPKPTSPSHEMRASLNKVQRVNQRHHFVSTYEEVATIVLEYPWVCLRSQAAYDCIAQGRAMCMYCHKCLNQCSEKLPTAKDEFTSFHAFVPL